MKFGDTAARIKADAAMGGCERRLNNAYFQREYKVKS